MATSKQTNLVIRHFSDRTKPCICLEQDNQSIIIGTLRNKECEELWNIFLQGCYLSREMGDLFDYDLKGENNEI